MNKLLPIISTFLLLITLSAEGFVAWKLYDQSTPTDQTTDEVAAEVEVASDDEPLFMDLGETTVNLHGSESDNNFLRIKIKILVDGVDAQERITQNTTQVTDLVLNVLSAQTFANIRTPEGKASLKRDLIERINRLVGHDPILDIFFVDFVSQ